MFLDIRFKLTAVIDATNPLQTHQVIAIIIKHMFYKHALNYNLSCLFIGVAGLGFERSSSCQNALWVIQAIVVSIVYYPRTFSVLFGLQTTQKLFWTYYILLSLMTWYASVEIRTQAWSSVKKLFQYTIFS